MERIYKLPLSSSQKTKIKKAIPSFDSILALAIAMGADEIKIHEPSRCATL